jgi:hypothetical protein
MITEHEEFAEVLIKVAGNKVEVAIMIENGVDVKG